MTQGKTASTASEKNETLPFSVLLQSYWQMTKQNHWSLLMVVLLINLIQVIAIVEPTVLSSMANDYMRFGLQHPKQILAKAGCALLVLFVQAILIRRKGHMLRYNVINLEHALKETLLRKMFALGAEFHDQRNATESYSEITRGIDRMSNLTFSLAQELIPLSMMFLVTSLAAAWFNGWLAALIAPVITAFALITVRVRGSQRAKRVERHKLSRAIDRVCGAAVNCFRTVCSFGQEENEIERLKEYQQRERTMLFQEYAVYDRSEVWRSQLIGVGRIGVVLICIFQRMSLTQLMLLSMLSERLFAASYKIGTLFDHFVEAVEPFSRLIVLLNEPIRIRNPEHPIPMPIVRGELVLKDLTCAYGTGSTPILKSLNLTIRAGETIAFVGESGAGKSTLVKALLRFIDPVAGQILLDGVDLRHMLLQTLRRAIGCVSQEIELFDGTVRELIAYGMPDASEEAIITAAKRANAHDFIMRFKDGYETRVGDRGLKLSGGQRQRIGIARVFLVNPPVILFDEATSSVDAESDERIREEIAQLSETGKTLIVIAHRLGSVCNASRICYIEQGRILESGTHRELLRRNGAYARMWKIYQRENHTHVPVDPASN